MICDIVAALFCVGESAMTHCREFSIFTSKKMFASLRRVHHFLCHAGCLAVFLGSLCAVDARAQALGAITGTVSDPSGAAVPNAKVTATETGTTFERSITADAAGRYTIPSLRPTGYTLAVETPGFRKFAQDVQ